MADEGEDEALLRRAEQALTQIKVSQGLSDEHASVLAAIRIRLKGDAGGKLEDLLEAAGDLESKPKLDSLLAEKKSKPSLDDLLSREPRPKKDWPA